MYFLLADMAERFHLLKYGLAVILLFIGAKMLLMDVYKIPVGIALGVVGLILAVSVVASLLVTRNCRPACGQRWLRENGGRFDCPVSCELSGAPDLERSGRPSQLSPIAAQKRSDPSACRR